jgi:integrase
MNEITVSVVEFADRKHFQMQFRDPVTGRKKTRSTQVERTGLKRQRTEAERVAAKWESELREGRYHSASKVTWEDFRQRYEDEALPRLSTETAKKVQTAFDLVERILKPNRLSDLTAEALSRWIVKVQAEGRSEATVAIYCRHLRAAISWALDMGLITAVPKMRIPKPAAGAKLMKGRPIVREEHERMLMAVGKVVPAASAPAWTTFLEGLWWSGLRLGEALKLSWDATTDVCAVVVPGSHAVVRFRVAGQKARREEIWPCPPEFAQLLERTPEAERIGRVFKTIPSVDSAGRVVSAIGKAAKVIVDEATDKPATAHDYRRAFGTRWSKLVMPATLKRLMRHKEIGTTMKYYVQTEAEDVADDLWAAFNKTEQGRAGNTLGNTSRKTCENSAVSAA